jgi:hypothetical protein
MLNAHTLRPEDRARSAAETRELPIAAYHILSKAIPKSV